ncbi:MAG: hypothetical protein U0X71_08810 [Sphingobacteriaceae bacterium]|jgi:hypothetical protein|nr:MAG: hypothetical protein E6Q66_07630 [Pedobacter sp.]
MKPSILTYPLTLSLLLSASILAAQVKKSNKPLTEKGTKQEQPKGEITEEVEVVRPYKPILADAVKIRKSPDLTNNPTFKPVLIYTILDKKLALDSNIAPLQAQKLVEQKVATPTNNYLKAAIGNFNTSQGELYLNNGTDEALQVGLSIKHLAQQGNIDKQQFSHQTVSTFGRSIGTHTTLGGRVNYDRKQVYFYGFDPNIATAAVSPDQQRFSLVEGNAELLSNYAAGNRFSYKLNTNAYLFNDRFNAKENNLTISTSLHQVVNKFNFGVHASLDLTNSKDITYSVNNHITRINPNVQFQASDFILTLGLNIVQEQASQNRLNVLPAVNVVIPLASSYASIFAGVNGDVIKTNLKSLSLENPYLNQNIAITNTIERLHIYGGIKGNMGHAFGFKATAFYKDIENMLLFQNNPSMVNRFDVVYDPGKSSLFGLDGELEIKASDAFNLTGKAQINSYKMATEQEAWLKPNLCLESTLKVKITKAFSLDASLTFAGETDAKVIDPLNSQTKSVKIDSFTDISAGAECRIVRNVRLYLRANNILGKSYQQYLYYPKLGFNIFGGLNFSF